MNSDQQQFTSQRISACFDRGAGQYDRLADVQHKAADQLLTQLERQLFEARNILDLGCGTGRLLRRCSEYNPAASIAGVDASLQMLSLAASANPNATFYQENLEATSLPAANFDLVISTSALQWTNLSLSIPELARLCAPNGRIAIACFLAETLHSWRRLWRVDSGLMPTKEQVLQGFDRLDLTVLSVERSTFIQRQSCFSSAVASVRDIGAGANAKSRRGLMGRDALADIKRQFEGQVQANGFFPMEYETLYLIAKK